MSQLGLDRQLNSFRRGKRSLIKGIAITSTNFFKDNFKEQRFVNLKSGRRWKKLKRPRKDGSIKPILVDTGNLKKSGKWHVVSESRAFVIFNAPYASFHNKGVKGRLPVRKFSGRSKKLNLRVEKLIDRYIARKFGGRAVRVFGK